MRLIPPLVASITPSASDPAEGLVNPGGKSHGDGSNGLANFRGVGSLPFLPFNAGDWVSTMGKPSGTSGDHVVEAKTSGRSGYGETLVKVG